MRNGRKDRRKEGKEKRCEDVHGLCFGQKGVCLRKAKCSDIKVNSSGLDGTG